MQDALLSWVRFWFYDGHPKILFENRLAVNGKILAETLKFGVQLPFCLDSS